ncbi:MAG: helix-turn-helix domain-containing protein [Acidimicrobiales bacterium]
MTVPAAEATRRRLTPRQAAVVEQLVEAAADEARATGYEGVTVRAVARRAGVAPATAYTYVASKDHLLAEVLWRRFEALPPVEEAQDRTTAERVTAELRVLGLFVADDPTVAAACTTALLGSGPEVRALRVRFGAALHDRLRAALGGDTGDVDETALRALDLAYSGAMLWAGMGHIHFEDVPEALADTARRLLGDRS